MKIVVLINSSANNGGAKKKWDLIEDKIKSMLPVNTIYFKYKTPCNLDNLLKSFIFRYKVKNFISAGGDGSLNNLLNSLARINKNHLNEYCIGAIGLGSSNDFHKPIRNQINGIPIKIDFANQELRDTGVVNIAKSGIQSKKLFLINSSIGFTAQGNYLFNKGDQIIRFLKKKSTNMAILWTVFKTLITFKNLYVQINQNNASRKVNITNLSIAKNPNISGNFRYDLQTAPDSGKLGLYLAENLSKLEALKLLYQLTKNRFSELKNCSVDFIQNLEILSDSNIALETDGEIFTGNYFRFSVLPKSVLIAR